MNSSKAEVENIEPTVGKEILDKYWNDVKHEIDDINIVSSRFGKGFIYISFGFLDRISYNGFTIGSYKKDHEIR